MKRDYNKTEAIVLLNKKGIKYKEVNCDMNTLRTVYQWGGYAIFKYDSKGRVLCVISESYSEFVEYDDENKKRHITNSNGYEYWETFDEQGRLIHFEDIRGYTERYLYTDGGGYTVMIFNKNIPDFNELKDYDHNGNLIHHLSTISEACYMYDKDNRQVWSSITLDGKTIETDHEPPLKIKPHRIQMYDDQVNHRLYSQL